MQQKSVMKAEKSKGLFIKMKRHQRVMSIKEVAEKVELSEATIYAIEAGDRNLSFKAVDAVMEAMKIEEKYRRYLLYPEGILEKDVLTRGEFIKLMRLEKCFNIPELAKMIGVSTSTLSCIEIGSRNLTNKVYKKLADKLGMEDIAYSELNAENIYMVYAIDVDYKVPVIKAVCLSEEDAIKEKNILKKEYPTIVWRIKEFSTGINVEENNLSKCES